jgi:hypothetical protein
LEYSASLVFFNKPKVITKPEDAEKLLAELDYRANGQRCFLWDQGKLVFWGDGDGFFSLGDFCVQLTDSAEFSFANHTKFKWDPQSLCFHFDHNSQFKFSNYHTGENPFSDVDISLETGKMSFLFTVHNSMIFNKAFPAGFDYGFSKNSVLSFPIVRKYSANTFHMEVELDFCHLKSSSMLLETGTSFESGFVTVYGERVTLTAGERAGFGFALRPSPRAAHCLAPLGGYSPSTPCGTHEKGILLGTSGTEYFILPPGMPLSFAPREDSGAYAPKFPAAAPSINDFVNPAGSLPLSNAYTTAWMKLPGGTRIYSQPEDNPYYTGSGALLKPAGLYTEWDTETPYFPVIPAGGSESFAYSRAVLAPARAVILAKNPARMICPLIDGKSPVHTAAAPSGFLLKMEGDVVQSILLTEDFVLNEPSHALVSAFNTSGMLLVAADDKALPYAFRVGISGWNLSFAASQSVLIVKSMRGKLYDAADAAKSLIGNVSVWTARDSFSSKNPAKVARDLMLFLEEAVNDKSNSEYYAPLVEAVTTENWRGCILVETPHTADSFPEELRVTFPSEGDVKMRYFCTAQAELMPDKNGPVFAGGAGYCGFMDYANVRGGTLPPPKDGGHAFRTLELKAFFKSGAMAHFSSSSQLDFPEICGVKTKLGAVMLRGGYIERDGMPSFALQAEKGNSLSFPDGSPLSGFSLSEIKSGNRVGADMLTLSGSMQFPALAPGDILSYDQLMFSEYILTGRDSVFKADTSGVIFHAADSVARKGSLCKELGFIPGSFSAGQSFSVLAYAGCRGKLADTIGGIQFTAVLGAAGSLSPGQLITARIFTGWDETGRLALGIRLPDVLPLEGVLSLTSGGARLAFEPGSGFSLYLSDIKLEVLGVLKLPLNGSATMAIQQGGWFAAYLKGKR